MECTVELSAELSVEGLAMHHLHLRLHPRHPAASFAGGRSVGIRTVEK